jgi:hypothetical protein
MVVGYRVLRKATIKYGPLRSWEHLRGRLYSSGPTVLFCPPVSVIGIEWHSKADSRLGASCFVHVLVVRRLVYVIVLVEFFNAS